MLFSNKCILLLKWEMLGPSPCVASTPLVQGEKRCLAIACIPGVFHAAFCSSHASCIPAPMFIFLCSPNHFRPPVLVFVTLTMRFDGNTEKCYWSPERLRRQPVSFPAFQMKVMVIKLTPSGFIIIPNRTKGRCSAVESGVRQFRLGAFKDTSAQAEVSND